MPLFDALFPFAKRGAYLLLYGRRGLAEYQSLVPHAAAAGFLAGSSGKLLQARPPLVMASLKLFRGEPGFVRFEADGVCVTLDLVRTPDALRFLERVDAMTLAARGLPHIVKDSRLPASVAARALPGPCGVSRAPPRARSRGPLPLRAVREARAVNAVVVGASAGLGRALAERLRSRAPRPGARGL